SATSAVVSSAECSFFRCGIVSSSSRPEKMRHADGGGCIWWELLRHHCEHSTRMNVMLGGRTEPRSGCVTAWYARDYAKPTKMEPGSNVLVDRDRDSHSTPSTGLASHK